MSECASDSNTSLLASLVLSIPDAIQAHLARLQQEKEEYAKEAERKKIVYRKKHRPKEDIQREEQAARDVWLAQVLDALTDDGVTTSGLGNAMGCSRTTAYRRLLPMEEAGHIYRTGESVSTRWLKGKKL